MTRWCIDHEHRVHNAACKFASGVTTPYEVKLKTNEEMLAHLARPDVKDRRAHIAAILACGGCIPTDTPEAP